MVRTNKNSRFVLLSLAGIRDSRDIVLQIEDSGAEFKDGQKCFLCEVISQGMYFSEKDERQLIREVCELNDEKRRLEKKVARLERLVEKMKEDEGK